MKIRPPHSGVLLLILIGIVVSFYFLEQADAMLANPAVTSGWILLGSFVILCLYGARKKVPFLPIGKTATWLQLHLGFGVISTWLFLEHVGYRFPTGLFETHLYVLYSLLLISGFLGWLVMRALPETLRADGREVNPLRIPDELAGMVKKSDDCIAGLEPGELNPEILKGYFEVVRPYLCSGCGILPSRIHPEFGVPQSLIQRLQDYESPTVLFSSEPFLPVQRIVREKAVLDLHRVRQRWMRGWLFVHVPVTGVMVLMIILHVILVTAFKAGGAS